MNLRKLVYALFLMSCVSHAQNVVSVWVGPSPQYIESARSEARRDAQADILANNLKVVSIGLPSSDERRATLLKKYHITEASLGCVADERAEIYQKEYTAIMQAEIEKRYGKEFWERFK